MRSTTRADGRPRAALPQAALLLWSAVAVGCADYKLTTSISGVRVETARAEIRDCRALGGVDSRDTARGCGLTVQPTPEECMKYQVRRAGGDTLLLRGAVGDAYDCSGSRASLSEAAAPQAEPVSPASPPPSTPPPAPAATLPAAPAATPLAASAATPLAASAATPLAASAATPLAASAAKPPSESLVRVVRDRGLAKGCVYLGDVDLKAACPGETGEAAGDCVSRRAIEAGGDTVFLEEGRAQVFSCKRTP